MNKHVGMNVAGFISRRWAILRQVENINSHSLNSQKPNLSKLENKMLF